MSVIKVTLPLGEIPAEGKQVSFKAPCPCDVTEAIQIEGVNYTVCDALGKCVTGIGGVWDVGSIVTVTLSLEQQKAYIQNNAGYAPSGYALGETRGTAVSGIDDITRNGWYSFWVDAVETNGPARGTHDAIASCDDRWGTVALDVIATNGKIGRTKGDSTGWGPWFKYLTTANKPSGSYTGNGSATARTINIGGLGTYAEAVLIVGTNNCTAIVTRAGAIARNDVGSPSGIEPSQIKFSSGVLTLATVHSYVNTNGVTYYYQVI